jgi:death on curing protein
MRFLSIEAVLELHSRSIERFGGTEGIRDRGSLESAVIHPQNVLFYARGDLYDVAAAYAFHIAESQAFLDGNKRTAAAAALAMLRTNHVQPAISELELYDLIIGIAEKRAGKAELAAYLRRTCRPV